MGVGLAKNMAPRGGKLSAAGPPAHCVLQVALPWGYFGLYSLIPEELFTDFRIGIGSC